MDEPDHPELVSSPPQAQDRLDSWKEVASYLRRDVRTVQRWERKEGLPIYRHRHDKFSSIYAFRSEIDEWRTRRTVEIAEGDSRGAPPTGLLNIEQPQSGSSRLAGFGADLWNRRSVLLVVVVLTILLASIVGKGVST